MKVSDLAQLGKRRLQVARIQCADPLLHMKQIFEFIMQIDSVQLAMKWNDEIEDDLEERVDAFLKRREAGEPFQYIVGYEWFWNSKFKVGPGVFIPRKETEILVEAILKRVPKGTEKVAELGAGSGNIGITLLQERLGWEWHTFEKNPDTLPYVKENRATCLPPSAVYLVHKEDFFEGVKAHVPFDGFVSNPPYIREDEMALLPEEVKKEPVLALDGGQGGMEVINRLIALAPQILRKGGWWASEIDFRQSEAVCAGLKHHGFSECEVINDYTHRPRVVFARLGKA